MNPSQTFKEKFKLQPIHYLITISFFIWVYLFRGFISGELAITSDATAYVEHFHYFIGNITRGVYPLWEAQRHAGTPIEFFLRRIGSYNPFFYLIVVLYKIGFTFITSYLIFLSIYYFIGMIGFYKIAKRILGCPNMAFVAYLLLLFSSLGTRLFDSYLILTVIPMIWFFYFFISFAQDFKRYQLLGITFTAMILVTTYVPFYFFTIVSTFLFCFSALYWKNLINILKQTSHFIIRSKVFAVGCLFAFLLSMIPGTMMFMDSSRGEFVLSERHGYSSADNVIEVGVKTITRWGLEEDLMYTWAFNDLSKFKFAIMYVPAFAFLVLLLGFFLGMNKRLILYFIWGFWIFAMVTHHGPLYRFLYENVFYFKYFRNLHFYLWLILLPLFILFTTEQLQVFLNYLANSSKTKSIIYTIAIHCAAMVLLYLQGNAIFSTYLVVVLSFCFFYAYINRWFSKRKSMIPLTLLLVICIHPIEVYGFLHKNVKKIVSDKYAYDYVDVYPKKHFKLNVVVGKQSPKERGKALLKETRVPGYVKSGSPSMYYGVKSFDFLRKNLDFKILTNYYYQKLIAYDAVQWLNPDDISINEVQKNFALFENEAFITKGNNDQEYKMKMSAKANAPTSAQIITDDSPEVNILNFDTNVLKLKTNFETEKFLVYNDNYYSEWKAFIDGEEEKVWQANVSFKGVWVPAGEHTVYFRYGATWRRIINPLLMILFGFVLLAIVSLWKEEKSRNLS